MCEATVTSLRTLVSVTDCCWRDELQVQCLTVENFSQLRGVSANQVLGTDMKKHFEITSRFQVRRVSLACTR